MQRRAKNGVHVNKIMPRGKNNAKGASNHNSQTRWKSTFGGLALRHAHHVVLQDAHDVAHLAQAWV